MIHFAQFFYLPTGDTTKSPADRKRGRRRKLKRWRRRYRIKKTRGGRGGDIFPLECHFDC
jgi:hypothetical protein